MEKSKDKTKIKIEDLLKSHKSGLTIKEIMDKTHLARHTVLARLHTLVGQDKIAVRTINMAKLHLWKDQQKDQIKDDNHDIKAEIEKELKKSKDKQDIKNIKKHIEHKEHIKKINEDVKIVPIEERHLKKSQKKTVSKKEPAFDMASLKKKIEEELRSGKIDKKRAALEEQRKPITHIVEKARHKGKIQRVEYIRTGIAGFDDLLAEGIPKASTVLLAGGAGSGKTIFALQTMFNHAEHGEKCLYMSFEESEENLIHHMQDFGWDPEDHIKKGNILIKRFNPFDITRSVDALLMKAKGELLINIEPIIFPEDFKPSIIVVDSLTAIASAFTGKDDSYRIYIEQLFRFFENIKATSFLITETPQIPTIFSNTGVEEFLADGVIVLYKIKHGNVRENAIEILKLRGAAHEKKIVAMQITDRGIEVYPEQEVFSEVDGQ